jgi:hypothetical protein
MDALGLQTFLHTHTHTQKNILKDPKRLCAALYSPMDALGLQAFRKSGQPAEAWANWLTSPEAFRDLCQYADPTTTSGQDPDAGDIGTPLRGPPTSTLSRPGSALRALRERKRRLLAAQATAQEPASLEVIVVEKRPPKSPEGAELADAGKLYMRKSPPIIHCRATGCRQAISFQFL